jgi:5-methylcytosine-specific restriction endonuclease McrA
MTAAIIARDGGCVDGGPHTGRLEVDHIIPLSAGGTNGPANLVTRCELHHRAKTRADPGAVEISTTWPCLAPRVGLLARPRNGAGGLCLRN